NRPLPMLPDLPSLSVELPGIGESSTWVALVAPAGTPDAIIAKIHHKLGDILTDPAHIAKLERIGIFVAHSRSPAEFAAFIHEETEQWAKVLKSTGKVPLD